MTLATAAAFLLLEVLAIAALSARPAPARFAFALAVMLLPWPAFVAAPVVWRSVFALGAFWCVVRSADFVLEPAPTSFALRFVHLLAIIDTRLVLRAGHTAPLRLWLLLAGASAAFVAAVFAVRAAGSLDGTSHYLLRWGAGIVLVLAIFEALTAAFRIGSAWLGYYAPRLSHYPLLARSVAEFWSARWNRVVGKVLRDRVFTPLAHRGAGLAVWATFVASAAFHFYLVGIVLRAWRPALAAAAFFLLQPLLLSLERGLRIRRRSRFVRHAWTLGALVLLAPLFIEPVLQMLGFD
jgi:hypothetical protein